MERYREEMRGVLIHVFINVDKPTRGNPDPITLHKAALPPKYPSVKIASKSFLL